MTQLWSVTCHMGPRPHSVICYPTQVNTSHLNPSHAGWYSIYLPWRDGRLNDLVDLIAPRPEVEPATFHLSITSPMLNYCTTKKTTTFSAFHNRF